MREVNGEEEERRVEGDEGEEMELLLPKARVSRSDTESKLELLLCPKCIIDSNTQCTS